jgi:hypothetical protein
VVHVVTRHRAEQLGYALLVAAGGLAAAVALALRAIGNAVELPARHIR